MGIEQLVPAGLGGPVFGERRFFLRQIVKLLLLKIVIAIKETKHQKIMPKQSS